ncbi:hypothetical protein P9112_008788 [Eukaryota sp. TZLM1-RC]
METSKTDEKIRIALDPEDHSCATFIISHETHTLGNVLRNVISRRPDVDFCAYSIPHPIEPIMNFRIQTRDSVKPLDVMQSGLSNLKEMSNIVLDKFNAAFEEEISMEQ